MTEDQTPNDVPTRVYKYRAWNCYTCRLFTHNELYFTCPLDFDDPYDCKITPIAVGSDEQWTEHLIRILPRKWPDWAAHQIEDEAKRLVADGKHKTEEFQENQRRNMIARQAKAGVLCLSAKRDSILMWSQYADYHRGVCVEFAHGEDQAFLGLKVCYRDEPTRVNSLDPDYRDRLLEDTVLTKASCWEYEEEYRIILPEYHGPRTFTKGALTGVILGCQMKDQQKREVSSLVRETHPQALIYHAIMRTDAFKLEIVPQPAP